MLLHLTEDQEFFRETTDRFLNELVPPDSVRALRHDETGFDRTYWRRGAELGWTSLLVGEEHGGGTISGAGLVDLSLVAYAFGRHAAPGPLAGTNVVASALSAHGAAPDVLASLLSGEGIATWCAPQSGPDGWRPTVEVSDRRRRPRPARCGAPGRGGRGGRPPVGDLRRRRRPHHPGPGAHHDDRPDGVADGDDRPDPSILQRHLRRRAAVRDRRRRSGGTGGGGCRPSVLGAPRRARRRVGRVPCRRVST